MSLICDQNVIKESINKDRVHFGHFGTQLKVMNHRLLSILVVTDINVRKYQLKVKFTSFNMTVTL